MIYSLEHAIGAIPILWLCMLQLRGAARGALWWGLAGAFGVSWLADTAAHWIDPLVVTASYPIVQVALIGAVLLSRTDALVLAWALCLVGAFAGLWEDPKAPDLFLRTVACGAVVGIAWPRRELSRVRLALLVTFGLGWLAWIVRGLWPEWSHVPRDTSETLGELTSAWGLYHAVRLAGIVIFCWACTTTRPPMPVARYAMIRTAPRL